MTKIGSKIAHPVAVPRPDTILAERYEQLQAWALSLTRGDAGAALDIVHDLYLYVSLAKPDFSRVENLDNYLYKCLRHIHLAHLAESSRNALQQISVTDLDSLQFAFWASPETFVLERQNELRRICRYAAWRKDHNKSASFFVLRFFHGYHLQEIAEITVLSMSVVQPKLSRMRSEIQHYLDNPDDPQFSAAPAIELSWTPVSSPELFRELRAAIMQTRRGDCPEESELLAHYRAPAPKPLSTSLLSHVVSCQQCLSVIDRHFGRPTLRDREPLDGVVSAAKGKSRKTGVSLSSLSHRELMEIVRRHHGDVYEHRPRFLSIAADGKIIASHRVQGQTSVQSARIEHPEHIGCVEVFSEQDVRLALLLLDNPPPDGPAVKAQHIELSDGRWIEMRLAFDSLGVSSEVTYFDPLPYADAKDEAWDSEEKAVPAPLQLVPVKPQESRSISVAEAPSGAVPTRADRPGALSPAASSLEFLSRGGTVAVRPVSHLWSKVKRMFFLEQNPLLAGAFLLALASVVCIFLWMYKLPRVTPTAFLDRAVRWDSGTQHDVQPGVIYQKVRITTRKRTMDHAIYRDAQGFRRPRRNKLSPEDEALRDELAKAGVNWDEPLSASNYRAWHDHVSIQRDQVSRDGQSLLKLTTTASNQDSLVLQETLTVRESDFHPVGRTVELRDSGTVEIAELNYDVLPWSMANPDWFEQPASTNPIRSPRVSDTPGFRLPRSLSDVELDEAELEARLALNRLHLDSGREMSLTRGADGIHVLGIVGTAQEKRDLLSQLALIPHILPAISTVEELNASQSANGVSSIQSQSLVASGPSSAERYFQEKGMDRIASLPLTQHIVSSAFVINYESKAISELWHRFGSSDANLSPNARMALSELAVQHKAALLAAIQEEQQKLIELRLISSAAPVSDSAQGTPAELEAAAQRNVSLCVELTSPGADQSRPAEEIAPQLAQTLARLRSTILRVSAASLISPSAPSKAAVENQNQ